MYRFFIYFIVSISIFACSKKETSLDDALAAFEAKYPNVKVESIDRNTDSFFEIRVDNQLYYLSSDLKYLIAGALIDFDTGENLTEASLKKARKKYISTINPSDLIIYQPDVVEHSIVIFTDTSCPYCQKMHNEIESLLNKNIEIKYILFSRNGNDNDAYRDMVSAWCSENRLEALDTIFDNNFIQAKSCDNPLEENFNKARQLGIEGTPMIFLEDGSVIPGYVSSDKITDILNKLTIN